ncbi:MAG: hypothetical protein LBV27_10490 [Oscillospiraceae bacterium]|jgi:hypothetical protein|nr:hypothetical protein [Oscillospiraceae bacterium]
MPDDIVPVDKRRKETFVVQIQFQQNASWQGTLTWTDQKKVQRFRSTLEMIKLIDEALSDKSGDDDDEFSGWQ